MLHTISVIVYSTTQNTQLLTVYTLLFKRVCEIIEFCAPSVKESFFNNIGNTREIIKKNKEK